MHHITSERNPQTHTAHSTRLLTRQEVADALATCLRTVDDAIASGSLEIVKIGRAVRIKESSLNEFIEARVTRRNPRHEPKMGKSLKGISK